MGTFEEITTQGFDVDAILQSYNKNATEALKNNLKLQRKNTETKRLKNQLSLVHQTISSVVSERDYVAAAMQNAQNNPETNSMNENEIDSFIEDEQKKQKKKRDKNIKLLKKQVMALAQEELAKT